jgi:hypothetical protein
MTRSWLGVYRAEVSTWSNNWVEKDAADRASHPKRYPHNMTHSINQIVRSEVRRASYPIARLCGRGREKGS